LDCFHSRLITTPTLPASIPLNCTVNGALASSNLTLLRMPSQPVAPVAAMDLSRLSPWTTSIQPSDDKVILYVLLYAGAGASINPANVVFDFGTRSGPTGSFTSPNGFSVTIIANGSGHVARLPEASFGKSVPVSVARSLSSGHLNLSHPTGSCAKAGAALTPSANKTNIGFTGRILVAHDLIRPAFARRSIERKPYTLPGLRAGAGNRVLLFGIML